MRVPCCYKVLVFISVVISLLIDFTNFAKADNFGDKDYNYDRYQYPDYQSSTYSFLSHLFRLILVIFLRLSHFCYSMFIFSLEFNSVSKAEISELIETKTKMMGTEIELIKSKTELLEAKTKLLEAKSLSEAEIIKLIKSNKIRSATPVSLGHPRGHFLNNDFNAPFKRG